MIPRVRGTAASHESLLGLRSVGLCAVMGLLLCQGVGCSREDKVLMDSQAPPSAYNTQFGQIDMDQGLRKEIRLVSHNSRRTANDLLEILISLTARTRRGATVEVTTDFFDASGNVIETVGPQEHALVTARTESLRLRASAQVGQRYLVHIIPKEEQKRGLLDLF